MMGELEASSAHSVGAGQTGVADHERRLSEFGALAYLGVDSSEYNPARYVGRGEFECEDPDMILVDLYECAAIGGAWSWFRNFTQMKELPHKSRDFVFYDWASADYADFERC